MVLDTNGSEKEQDFVGSIPARRANDVDHVIGLRIRMRRTMLQMSQDQLAAACNISAQQIHKYERGRSSIRASRLLQISRILKTPISFFYSDLEQSETMPTDLVGLLADPDNIDALMAFRQVADPASRAKLIEVIRVFADQHDARDDTIKVASTA